MKPDFEEKTFEVAANTELALLGAGLSCPGCGGHHCVFCGEQHQVPAVDLWAPGQVLEGVLGFDVLVDLDGEASDLQALLGVAIPAGMNWKSHFGGVTGVGSAPKWASIFIQYKRSDWVTRRHGVFKTKFSGPFHRFDVDPDQHALLAGLREAAAGEALVIYAAPRFHANDDMLHYRRNRLVLERTAFIEVESGADHHYGAYDETSAWLCSDPEAATGLSLPGLLSSIRRLDLPAVDSSSEALRTHIATVAGATRFMERIDSIDDNEQGIASDIAAVLQFALRSDVRWVLAAVAQ